MFNYQTQSTIHLAIALTVATGCVAQGQSASAQLVELATEAFNTLNNINGEQPTSSSLPPTSNGNLQPSTPWNNSDFNLGTENFNGNTINLCISGCPTLGNQSSPSPNLPYKTHLPIHFERL